VPIVTRVFDRLRDKGLEVPDNIFTVDRAVEYLLNLKKRGVNID